MSAVGTVPQKILDELTESGIKDPVSKKVLFPKDGAKFLAAAEVQVR